MDDVLKKAIDLRYLLLESYKNLGIREPELAVLLMIDHLLSQGNSFITQELLALKMSLTLTEIDRILTDLVQKKFLEYENVNNEMRTTLRPLEEKLWLHFENTFLKQRQESLESDFTHQVENIYGAFEKEWGRTLSPVEFQKIREWISYGYTDEVVLDALKEASSENKRSVRSVDRILLKKTSRDDLKKEGYTAMDDRWRNNIEQTIAIASEKWVTDDEKED